MDSSDRMQRDNISLRTIGWDSSNYSIQNWLNRTANGTLKNTVYGRDKDEDGPHISLLEDPLLKQIYLIDMALFIASEKVSYLATSSMVSAAPDEASQVFMASQVMDEARHYEIFCRRFADFGYTPEKRNDIITNNITPALKKFHDLILEQADKRDFLSTIIAQNIIMEGMAYPIYSYEYKYWSIFDPSLSKMIKGAFADEVHHVSFGESILAVHIRNMTLEQKNKILTIVRQFEGLMQEVFEEIINHYIGMYQECANEYMGLVGDIEIFKGKKMKDVSEEYQARRLLNDIQMGHKERLARVGFTL